MLSKNIFKFWFLILLLTSNLFNWLIPITAGISVFLTLYAGYKKINFGDEVYNRINNGIYISAPAGSDVSVSESGVVTFVGKEEYFGNIIIVKHPNNWVSSYAHMGDVNVIIGDKIKKGQIIGDVGMTGIINSPQLYFEMRRGTIVQNPLDFLD